MLLAVVRDLRYSIRMLVRNRGFLAVVVLTLAIVIGAATAVFSILHAVLLKPLPLPDPERLVMIWNLYGENRTANSPPDYFDRLEFSTLLEETAAFRLTDFNLSGNGDPERVGGARVTASFFDTLGVRPMLGRAFLPEEDRPETGDAAVISQGCWVGRFGRDPDIVGETVRLNDRLYRIMGVMPESFGLLFPEVEMWVPLALGPDDRADENRGNEYLSIVGRFRPGSTVEQVQSEMDAIAAGVLERVPSRRNFLLNAKWGARVVPLHEAYSGDLRPVVQVLFGAVILVLLIACSNIASLSLARGTTRRKEVSIRMALGAERPRIVRLLLIENLCLAFAGTVLGLLLAGWCVGRLSEMQEVSPLLAGVGLHPEILLFAAGLMVFTTLLFGLAPAIRLSSFDIANGLKAAARVSAALAGQKLRRVLVIGEIALAVLLLVAAGLLIRSSQQLLNVDPGYEASERLTFRISLPETRYSDNAQRVPFHNEVLTRLENLAGVSGVGAIQSLPIAGSGDTATIHVEDHPVPPGQPEFSGEYRYVSPGYFQAMGIPLLQGRFFSASDTLESPAVVLVDEKAAQRYWPGENPIGKGLGFSPRAWREVVGVVGSVLNEGLDVPGKEQVYFPLLQRSPATIFYVLHTRTAPLGLTSAVRNAIQEVDASIPVYDIRSMEERISESMGQRRLATTLLTVFALIGILLAAIGIFGVIATWVRHRLHELGIRVALGAQPAQIFKLVVGQGMWMAATGVIVGCLASLIATRFLEALLFNIEPYDPYTFATGIGLLFAVAFLACYLPARRAMKLDPVIVLRFE